MRFGRADLLADRFSEKNPCVTWPGRHPGWFVLLKGGMCGHSAGCHALEPSDWITILRLLGGWLLY